MLVTSLEEYANSQTVCEVLQEQVRHQGEAAGLVLQLLHESVLLERLRSDPSSFQSVMGNSHAALSPQEQRRIERAFSSCQVEGVAPAAALEKFLKAQRLSAGGRWAVKAAGILDAPGRGLSQAQFEALAAHASGFAAHGTAPPVAAEELQGLLRGRPAPTRLSAEDLTAVLSDHGFDPEVTGPAAKCCVAAATSRSDAGEGGIVEPGRLLEWLREAAEAWDGSGRGSRRRLAHSH